MCEYFAMQTYYILGQNCWLPTFAAARHFYPHGEKKKKKKKTNSLLCDVGRVRALIACEIIQLIRIS